LPAPIILPPVPAWVSEYQNDLVDQRDALQALMHLPDPARMAVHAITDDAQDLADAMAALKLLPDPARHIVHALSTDAGDLIDIRAILQH
jgi:hypothetical protein